MNRKFESMNIIDYLFILKKHLRVILVMVILLSVASFLASEFVIPPKYSSSAQLIVKGSENTDAGTQDLNDITMSQQLVTVYAIIMKSDPVLTKVISDLNLGMTTDQLASMITVDGVNQTEVMQVTVRNGDPALAAQIANEVAKVSPDIILESVNAGSVKILSTAKVDNHKVSPNVALNVVLALLIGLVLGAGYAIAREMIDNTFKSNDDVERVLGLSVLGVIPRIDEKNPSGKTSY